MQFYILTFDLLHSDIDECLQGLDTCGSNTVCINMEGSFECICMEGFVEIDGQCVLQQQMQCDICHENAFCVIVEGSTMCQCEEGFSGDGFTCEGEHYT